METHDPYEQTESASEAASFSFSQPQGQRGFDPPSFPAVPSTFTFFKQPKDHREVMTSNSVYLISHLDLIHTPLLEGLLYKGVLTELQKSVIQNEPSNDQKVRHLLEHLYRSPAPFWEGFIECLSMCNHEHVANFLKQAAQVTPISQGMSFGQRSTFGQSDSSFSMSSGASSGTSAWNQPFLRPAVFQPIPPAMHQASSTTTGIGVRPPIPHPRRGRLVYRQFPKQETREPTPYTGHKRTHKEDDDDDSVISSLFGGLRTLTRSGEPNTKRFKAESATGESDEKKKKLSSQMKNWFSRRFKKK